MKPIFYLPLFIGISISIAVFIYFSWYEIEQWRANRRWLSDFENHLTDDDPAEDA